VSVLPGSARWRQGVVWRGEEIKTIVSQYKLHARKKKDRSRMHKNDIMYTNHSFKIRNPYSRFTGMCAINGISIIIFCPDHFKNQNGIRRANGFEASINERLVSYFVLITLQTCVPSVGLLVEHPSTWWAFAVWSLPTTSTHSALLLGYGRLVLPFK
jgi:hypothetical protein